MTIVIVECEAYAKDRDELTIKVEGIIGEKEGQNRALNGQGL